MTLIRNFNLYHLRGLLWLLCHLKILIINWSIFHLQLTGVKNFDKFHNAGYNGLYNGETADDIAKRKGLRYREDILDNIGSEELAANLFRITQTESRLKKDNIQGEKQANKTHYKIGKNIREVIAKNGGTMPEDLPTPKKSLKQLEKEKSKQLKARNV